MSLIAKEGESNFKPVPPGMHLARCYRVIDLGTQKGEFQGKVNHLPKIMVQFEVHGEDDAGNPLVTDKGEPMSISKNYTRSLGEKATLRKDLQGWRGREFTSEELRGFELKNILGHWSMLTIAKALGQNGKEYTNIMSVNPVHASLKKAGLPAEFNKAAIFSLDDPDMEMFETFSKFIKEKIMSSPEWKSRGNQDYTPEAPPKKGGGGFDDMEDDLPF